MVLTEATATAEASATALPTPPGLPEAVPLPPEPAFVADRFAALPTPGRLAAAEPDLGAGPAQSHALADFRAAKRDLRHAKAIPTGTAGRQREVRQARREVRTTKAELQGLESGGLATEAAAAAKGGVFGKVLNRAAATQAEAKEGFIGGLAPGQAKPPNEHGLALGRQTPSISQLFPGGNDGTYTNAEMNCAPAAMAMIARQYPGAVLDGKPVAQMPDAELINRLGRHGQTDWQGTSPNGVLAMAEELGLPTSSRMGGFNQGYYDAVLARGGSVIANGAYPINGEMAGHFMSVTGKTPEGNYLVNDPLLGQTMVYTPQDLDLFLRSNQVNGGVSLGIG